MEGREDITRYIDYISVMYCPECERGFPPDKEVCDNCGGELEWKPISFDLWFDPDTGEELYRCPFLRKVRNKDRYRCRIHDTKPSRCRDFPIVISTECSRCGLNFVQYFKDTKLQHIPLEEYLEWNLDDFFIRVLKNVENCPKCGEHIPKFSDWAIENCPGVKLFLRNKV